MCGVCARRCTPISLTGASGPDFSQQSLVAVLYQRALAVTHDSGVERHEVIPWRGEDLRYASSRETADGFLSH